MQPHAGQPVATAGARLEDADTAMILVHGRGATSASILTLADALERPHVAYLAPQAAGQTWYPYSFLAPIADNEPGLSSALTMLADLVEKVTSKVTAQRTLVLGFSQGACLTLEFVARHPARYGGVIGLTGGLIGPPGTPRDYDGTFAGAPVFLGASDPDPHVPWRRIEETAGVLRGMGAEVTLRRYPGMAHIVNDDELAAVRRMVDAVA